LVEPEKPSYEQFGLRGYSMHSCIHSWTRCVLNKEWDWEMARLALWCTASTIPKPNADNWWIIQRRLLQHAVRCVYLVMNNLVKTERSEWCFHSLGNLYRDQGKLAEAEKMYERALQGNEEALGPKHTSTLDTVHTLGNLYRDLGKLAEAEKMFERALQEYKEVLGPILVSTYVPALDTMFNLGIIYSEMNEKDMAKAMYEKAFSGFTIVRGPLSKECQDIRLELEGLELAPPSADIRKVVPKRVAKDKSVSAIRNNLAKLET
jgi:hypothetical protein